MGCGDEGTPLIPNTAGVADPQPAKALTSSLKGTTAIRLDPAFSQQLDTLGITVQARGTSTFAGGVLTLPLDFGDFTYFGPASPVRPFVQGRITYRGANVVLAAGGKEVLIARLEINLGPGLVSSDYVRVPDQKDPLFSEELFTLDGRTLQPLRQEPGGAVLDGATLKLTQNGADVLNKALSVSALKVGEVVGKATFDLTGTAD